MVFFLLECDAGLKWTLKVRVKFSDFIQFVSSLHFGHKNQNMVQWHGSSGEDLNPRDMKNISRPILWTPEACCTKVELRDLGYLRKSGLIYSTEFILVYLFGCTDFKPDWAISSQPFLKVSFYWREEHEGKFIKSIKPFPLWLYNDHEILN